MPNQQTLVAHIRELIGNGKLKQALTELNTWTENNADEDTQQTATLHLASYTNNERSNSMNFITRDEYLRETARINNAVLTLLNDLQHTPKKRNKSTSEPTTTNPVHNIYNIGSIHDANFGTSVHGSKNVNTGNISAGSNVTIGDGNNAGVETFKNKKTSWLIGAAAAMAGLIAFIANIGAIKESFFLKEEPKVLAAPTIEPQKQGVINIDSLRDLRDKSPNSHKIYDQLSFKSDTPNNHKRLDALKLEPIENKIKGIPYDVKNKIFVNNRAKVGAIITGDSNKINIKQEF